MRIFTKEFIIVFLTAVVLISAVSILSENKATLPDSQWYFLKTSGEWIRVNVLTFSAIEKQQLHLEYASRRLEEAIALKEARSGKECGYINHRYELELARAEYMAEQLSLLDPQLRGLLTDVYRTSLEQLKLLRKTGLSGLDGFLISAQLYNGRSIKTLLHKYQFSEEDTQFYKQLVQDYIDYKLILYNSQPNEQLKQAQEILQDGIELEWAYDIAVSA